MYAETEERTGAITADTAPSGPDAVKITKLTKSYGDVRAVDGIDVTIPAGQVVALLGPNGAGKSTTIDMLLGLSRPDSGEVLIYGKAPRQAVLAGQVGAMLQEGSLLEDTTVEETVKMISSLHKSPMPVDEALRLAGVQDVAKRRCTKLSGGQKQRVRFAVALISNPDLIVLDEPTAAMDVGARREFWTSMRDFTSQGRTVLFATHYMAEAEEFADRVVFLRGGRIAADGSVAEIRSLVSGRVVKATVPGARLEVLQAMAGVTTAEIRGDLVELACANSDLAMPALINTYPQARNVEVRAAGLEEAFLTLTGSQQ